MLPEARRAHADIQAMDGQWRTARRARLSLLLTCVDPMPTTARERLIVSPHRCRYKDCFLIWRRQRGDSQAKRAPMEGSVCIGNFAALPHRPRPRCRSKLLSWASGRRKERSLGVRSEPRQCHLTMITGLTIPEGVQNLRPRVVKPSRWTRSGEKSGGRKL